MLVWIISHDVAFSYDLKTRLLGSPVLKPFRQGLAIEVFQSVSVLKSPSKKVPKSAPIPSLVIIDPFPDWQETLELYLAFLGAGNPMVRNVLFCSSMAYGRFGDFFRREGMEPPPFVLKTDVGGQLEKLLAPFLAGETPPPQTKTLSPSLPPLLARRVLEDLKQAVSRLEGRYYGEGPLSQGLKELTGDLGKIQGLLAKGGFEKLAQEAEEFLSFLSGGKQVTPVRIKRDLKEFLTLCTSLLK